MSLGLFTRYTQDLLDDDGFQLKENLYENILTNFNNNFINVFFWSK